jgi:hypothetical protein
MYQKGLFGNIKKYNRESGERDCLVANSSPKRQRRAKGVRARLYNEKNRTKPDNFRTAAKKSHSQNRTNFD